MDESVVKHLEQTVGTLKLSEAIRIGARMRPRGTGFLFAKGLSCALGAAWEGLGNEPLNVTDPGYEGIYQELYRRHGKDMCRQVLRMNDQGWTREAIADWLESRGY